MLAANFSIVEDNRIAYVTQEHREPHRSAKIEPHAGPLGEPEEERLGAKRIFCRD